jgi:hypothetical protein
MNTNRPGQPHALHPFRPNRAPLKVPIWMAQALTDDSVIVPVVPIREWPIPEVSVRIAALDQ